jgi:hypothetical protein
MLFQRFLTRSVRLFLLGALSCVIATAAAAAPASAAVTRPGLPMNGPGLTVSLSASPTTLGFGDTTTLTATASENVGPTPYWIEIFDVSTGILLANCPSGTTCTAYQENDQSLPPGITSAQQEYVAYVASGSTAFPPSGIQATSPAVYVVWSEHVYQLSLSVTGTGVDDNATATSAPGLPSTLSIQLYLETGTGLELQKTCGPGASSCAFPFTASTGGSTLVAFVKDVGLPYLPFVAASNIVTTRTLLIIGR